MTIRCNVCITANRKQQVQISVNKQGQTVDCTIHRSLNKLSACTRICSSQLIIIIWWHARRA